MRDDGPKQFTIGQVMAATFAAALLMAVFRYLDLFPPIYIVFMASPVLFIVVIYLLGPRLAARLLLVLFLLGMLVSVIILCL